MLPAVIFLWPQIAWGDTKAGHVLLVGLTILVSTGKPFSHGSFDTAPFKEWGLAIPPDMIDISSFTKYLMRFPKQHVSVPVLEPIGDAQEWLIKVLRPFGYMLVVGADGRLRVVTAAPPHPTEVQLEVLETISFSDLVIDTATGQPAKLEGPGADADARIVSVAWRDSPFLADGKVELAEPITVRLGEDLDALATAGETKSVEMEG